MAKIRRRSKPVSPYDSQSSRAALVRDEKLYEVDLQGKTVLAGEMWVPLEVLTVDPHYQRQIKELKAQRIAAKWSQALAGLITVSCRSKDQYAILDGQTRARALSILREPRAWCEVFYDLTPEQEAYIFDVRNGQRTPTNAIDGYRAKLAYHDPQTERIQAVVESLGMHVGSGSGNTPLAIKAMSALRTVETWGVLLETLTLIRRAWPTQVRSTERAVLLGVGSVVWNFRDRIDGKRFEETLGAAPFLAMLSNSRSARALVGGREWEHFAREVVRNYDKDHRGSARLGEDNLHAPQGETGVGSVT